jgi:hypothetical protein
MVKEYTVKREGLATVHQFCPSRPYLELHLPDDVHSVLYVDYTVFSRDQGQLTPKLMLDCDFY